MKTTYDVDYFIEKFSKIPDELWCTMLLNHSGRSCAYGHCGVTHNNISEYTWEHNFTEEGLALTNIFMDFFRESDFKKGTELVPLINDGTPYEFLKKYNQPAPKQRILAALYDIKKLQAVKPEEPQYTTVITISPEVKILANQEIQLS